MSFETIGISLYVLLMLVIGAWVSRRVATDDDYFLAGRSLGPALATFSIFATWFGAETCIGSAGNVYREGLSGAHADPFAYGACILLMGIFLAKVLWQKKITTIPDLFRQRWSPGVERAAALIMLPSSIVWAGAQIRAFGYIIGATTEFDVTTAITIAATVVIFYTLAGGLLADAYADFIQGIALMVGLVILVVVLVGQLGGLDTAMAAIPAERWDIWRAPAGTSLWSNLERWLVPVVGSLVAQELVSRVVASRSAKIAVRASIVAGVMYMIVGFIPVFIGLIGPQLISSGMEGDALLPTLAKTYLPSGLYIIFVGALVSAILSTVDSTLLAASALATHNLVYPSFPNFTERKKVMLARGGVFIGGVCAYGIAFMSDSVSELVELASSLGGPTILVMTLFALTRWGNANSAWAAIIASLSTWVIGHFIIPVDAPVLMTVLAGLGAYLGSLFFIGRKIGQKTEAEEKAPSLEGA